MRRQLALLVAATTSVVLLAFLLPLSVLVSRVAASNAISDATSRSQAVVSAVASGAGREEVAEVSRLLEAGGLTVTVTDLPASDPDARRATVTRSADGGALLRQPVVVDGQSRLVQTRVPADQLREGVVRAWTVLAVLGLVLVALSLLVADRLARSITAPITDLARTTRRLGAGDLDARATPGGPDEVRAVGTAVNLLAARIRELLKSERESVADLSHRLRTPVTALRLDVEALPAGADRERLTADVDELVRQVDALIVEARRPVREGVEPRCDARAVVDERVEFWRALAEDQDREVRVCLPAGPCPVRVGVADLEAALDALLGNVLAHTPDRVAFEVGLSADPAGGALLTVTDEGPGFADASVVARGRSGAGSTGLGLDIARRTATASGGSLQVERAPTSGARVLMRLGPPGAG
jgi:signal transduction histidine kinase